jgi:hypothetical protein
MYYLMVVNRLDILSGCPLLFDVLIQFNTNLYTWILQSGID